MGAIEIKNVSGTVLVRDREFEDYLVDRFRRQLLKNGVRRYSDRRGFHIATVKDVYLSA